MLGTSTYKIYEEYVFSVAFFTTFISYLFTLSTHSRAHTRTHGKPGTCASDMKGWGKGYRRGTQAPLSENLSLDLLFPLITVFQAVTFIIFPFLFRYYDNFILFFCPVTVSPEI